MRGWTLLLMGSVAGMTKIRKLVLGGCDQITDAGLAHLAGMSGIESLILGRCYNITEEVFACLANLPNLRWLYVGGTSVLGISEELIDGGRARPILEMWYARSNNSVWQDPITLLRRAWRTLRSCRIKKVSASTTGTSEES